MNPLTASSIVCKRRLGLLGLVRLPDDVPANQILRTHCEVRDGELICTHTQMSMYYIFIVGIIIFINFPALHCNWFLVPECVPFCFCAILHFGICVYITLVIQSLCCLIVCCLSLIVLSIIYSNTR